ncbi:MAG: 50S ribosomal protein L4 [Clostridiales bacterium]|nr:50S ribosomal protein L4 [Clostridiales bacterium]
MAKVAVYTMDGAENGQIELNDQIFGVEVNIPVMHEVVVAHLAKLRQGTQSALTRAEVRGGGRKPWRQKGTGHARQGSIRAPQWVGGGVVFAPKPRDYSVKVNKKVRRLALKSALSSKVQEQKIVVLENLELNEIKTKAMKKVLENLKVENALVVMDGDNNKNVILSARNLPGIKTERAEMINTYDILKYDTLVVTKDAVAKIEEVFA